MAKYRPIQIRIWKDPDFEKYNSNMKLIFIYLCTNPLTTESGIYAISTKTISQDTNISEKTVIKLLSNGLKNIAYDFESSCVFIKNFVKYSVGGNPKLIQKSIENNYDEFNTLLWNEFIDKYPEYSNGFKRVNKPLSKGSLEIDNSNRSRNSSSNRIGKTEKKVKYADDVMMTETEYNKLKEEYGENKTNRMIEILDNYKGSKGKKYKSDYKAIRSWVVDKVINKKSDWRIT